MSASTAAFESGSESTVPDGPVVPAPRFDPDAGWRLHHQVAVRPEPFGALLYHFGTRKLSFLKNRKIVEVVNALVIIPTRAQPCVPPASTTTSRRLTCTRWACSSSPRCWSPRRLHDHR